MARNSSISKSGSEYEGSISTVIGSGAILDGTFEFTEAMRVDGIIKGEIKSKSTIVVGENGSIQGNIYAENIVIAGRIEGDIKVNGRLEISSTGEVKGDVTTRKLVIDEDAKFDGKCSTAFKEDKTVIMKAVAKEA